ncbi:MAG: hypothetical protein ACI9VS_004185, partial [Candidatus Binatia bacterium]
MRIKQILLSACMTLALAAPLSAADKSAEWTPLFDGITTKGWTPREEVIRFEAKDGELHLISKKNVWVASDVKMANFIV